MFGNIRWHTRDPDKMRISSFQERFCPITIAPFGDAYEKIGTIQRRLAWPLHKDDTLFQSGRPTGLNIYFILNFTYCFKHSKGLLHFLALATQPKQLSSTKK